MNAEFIACLKKQDGLTLRENAPMREYTSFQTGGTAELLVSPETREELLFALGALKERHVPFYVIGAGSNLLISDKGLTGVVIRLAKPFSNVTCEGNIITAEAGITLARLAAFALSKSLTGLEFAAGIPGTLGGAVFMNAGAYGGEMKDVVIETEYIDEDGTVKTVQGDAHGFGYRKSIFAEKNAVIVSSKMKLIPGDAEKIRETMQDLGKRRVEKQPLNYPSAGSTFKRPEGYYAGALIQEAGLKGFSVGGAEVSEKHAGFVINKGTASSQDIYRLICEVQERVFAKSGVRLTPEVRMLGDFSE